VQSGFFLRKKPLECVLSVYVNSEKAIAARTKKRGDDGLHRFLSKQTEQGNFFKVSEPARNILRIGK
jgi:hypothetical protein